MTQSTSSVPSLQYFGSRVNQAFNNAATTATNAFDRVQAALNSIANTFRAVEYGLRQEVPFERWFYDHGFQNPIDAPMDQMKARMWAVVATCEGAARVIAETVSYVLSLVMEPQESHRHKDVLIAQLTGLGLSLVAILTPDGAKTLAHNEGNSRIGASLLSWRWGSLYTGTLDSPLWKVECRHYPWIDRPNT